ncbi:MAG: hypothetical protein ACTSP4_15380 [Candidatus Hodarchaeales archaeon]
MTLTNYCSIFSALGNEKRLEIFELVLKKGFISKKELAIDQDLKRASLNHHLKIMIETDLLHEKELILDGRKQFFILPAVRLHPEKMIEKLIHYQSLSSHLDNWAGRNLTSTTWQQLRKELYSTDIHPDVISTVETRLFPVVDKTSQRSGYCVICRDFNSRQICQVCKHPVCDVHLHKIERDEQETVFLCPNCVEKFFAKFTIIINMIYTSRIMHKEYYNINR